MCMFLPRSRSVHCILFRHRDGASPATRPDAEKRNAPHFRRNRWLKCCTTADTGTCPRCQAWEKEGHPGKSSCSAKPAIRGTGSARTPLLFKREPSRMHLLSKYNSAVLRAGAVPAMLPFHSRLFRRAHQSTRQARKWVVQNLSKAAIKANHARCDLCSPCAPCLLPFWGYQLSARTSLPAVRQDAPRRHACEELLQPLRRSPSAHRGHHIANGQKVDHASVGPHQVEGFGKHISATAAQSLHSLCSLRGTGDSSQKGGRPRPSDCTQTRTKCHSSCSHMLRDSCESWQLVPAEDNYLVVGQVCSFKNGLQE